MTTQSSVKVLLICAWIVWLQTEAREGFVARNPEWEALGAAETRAECEQAAEAAIGRAFTGAATAGDAVLLERPGWAISTKGYRLSVSCWPAGHRPEPKRKP